MTKIELKSIIKECLLEILTDGLGNSLMESNQRKQVVQKTTELKEREKMLQERKREMADKISFVTNDPVLRDMLAHTARTTLREQRSHEPMNYAAAGGTAADNETFSEGGDAGIDISSMLGGVASKNWATVAFASKKAPGQ